MSNIRQPVNILQYMDLTSRSPYPQDVQKEAWSPGSPQDTQTPKP
jgi:hypothetical protein